MPTRPAMDAMLMILPACWVSMTLPAVRAAMNAPSRLTSRTRRNCSVEVSCARRMQLTPALFTRTSNRPQRDTIRSTPASIVRSSAMSPTTASVSHPVACREVITSVGVRTSFRASAYPSFPSVWAMQRPMPCAAPVMSTTRLGSTSPPDSSSWMATSIHSVVPRKVAGRRRGVTAAGHPSLHRYTSRVHCADNDECHRCGAHIVDRRLRAVIDVLREREPSRVSAVGARESNGLLDIGGPKRMERFIDATGERRPGVRDAGLIVRYPGQCPVVEPVSPPTHLLPYAHAETSARRGPSRVNDLGTVIVPRNEASIDGSAIRQRQGVRGRPGADVALRREDELVQACDRRAEERL